MDQNERKAELSPGHKEAVLQVFMRQLGAGRGTVDIALGLIFGKKITYGGLYDLTQEDFSVTREAFKEAISGVPTMPLKRCLKVLSMVTPASPVCGACGSFPIDENALEGGMQTRGICPVCQKGKIEATVVAVDFVEWTTGNRVPVGKDLDTTTVPGAALPLHSTGIFTYLTQTHGEPGNRVLMDLLVKKDVPVPLFLLYLRVSRGAQIARLQQPKACLRFLVDPEAFDVTELVELELWVDEAKQFRNGAQLAEAVNSAPPPPAARLPDSFFRDRYRGGMAWPNPKVQQFHHALCDAYDSPDRLRGIMQQAGISPAYLNMSGSMDTAWHNALNLAASMGLIDTLVDKIMADPSIGGQRTRLRDLFA